MTTTPSTAAGAAPAAAPPIAPVGFDPQYFRTFQDKLFIAGPTARRRLLSYYVLLLLATVIATFGLITGSPATVIGAMIVAPLMQPIMATAAAVIMGDLTRTLRALALVVSGIIIVVLLSWALTFLLPDVLVSFESNGELASRISPGLIALLTALASGAAGAFIATREEIADSLAGVAIAISLVPPLSVVGIALSHGRVDAALGAFLLFLTNFLAILLAGGGVFLLLGLGGMANSWKNKTTQVAGLAVIGLATALIAIPLTATSTESIRAALDDRAAAAVVQDWLGDSTADYVSSDVRENVVLVYITGAPGARPLQPLADRLADELKRPVIVNLRLIPSEQVRTQSGTP